MVLELVGRDFGASDMSLAADIGTAGCVNTVWGSDSSLQCRLKPGVAAAQVPLAAVQAARLCRKCSSSQILVGCSDLSAGYCAECQACGAGAYREACIPGTDAPGYCVACPNDGLADGQRFYKPASSGDDEGSSPGGGWQDLCSPCSVCGGTPSPLDPKP